MLLFTFYQYNPLPPDISDNEIFPHFIVNCVPRGLAGVIIASLPAAVISSINSPATITMEDWLSRFQKRVSDERTSLIQARCWTVFWGVAGTLSAWFISVTALDTIGRVSTQVIGLFAGAIPGIFLQGIFTRRANAPGVLIGGGSGALAAVPVNYCLVRTLPDGRVVHVSYVVPMIAGSFATLVTGFAASLFFPAPGPRQLNHLTVFSLLKCELPPCPGESAENTGGAATTPPEVQRPTDGKPAAGNQFRFCRILRRKPGRAGSRKPSV